MPVGVQDIDGAAEALARRVPDPLRPLARAAYNLRWSWTPGGSETFRTVDPRRWELCGENPVRLLTETSAAALERAAADAELVARGEALEEAIAADLARPAASAGPVTPERPVAFFCAEYGIHASLPIYSGGLGALAGDILKEASDRALPLVAVGLLYHQGYFRQRIDAAGWQHESWVPTDPERQPAALVRGDDGEPLEITVPVGDEDVVAQLWRVDVGRVPLFLLDADRPENSRVARWITSRLYTGTRDLRLAQYALLGVGGMRALRAMGIDPSVVHLNEGHAAFAALELARGEVATGATLDDALAAARARTVFTTHTPGPGRQRHLRAQPRSPSRSARWRARSASTSTGRDPPRALAPRRRRRALRRHPVRAAHEPRRQRRQPPPRRGRARACGRPCGPTATSPTSRSATSPTACTCPPGWATRCARCSIATSARAGWSAPTTPRRGSRSTPSTTPSCGPRAARSAPSSSNWARERSVADRLGREDPREYVEAPDFDPDVLTIGFARRLATYKRLHLLLRSAERIVDLLHGERSVQILLAGKAHPRDDDGKRSLQALFSAKGIPEISHRVAYLDDYDLSIGARLVRGCDVWVNVPRPPLEASGTSGMKSAVNGGLQLSVLDGWWAEAYDGSNGWALPGDVDDDHAAQDTRDADELLRLLYDEVVPAFYDRDDDGLPRAWLARVKASLRTNGPEFSASRMVRDYVRQIYT